jgi:hypothetical protein
MSNTRPSFSNGDGERAEDVAAARTASRAGGAILVRDH